MNGFFDRTHLNSHCKTLVAKNDAAINNIIHCYGAIRMVAHDKYKSGGHAPRHGHDLIDANDVPLHDDSAAVLRGAATAFA